MGDAGASSVQVSGEAQDAGGWGAAVDDLPPTQARMRPKSTHVAPSRFSASRSPLSVTCPPAAPGSRSADGATRSVTPCSRWLPVVGVPEPDAHPDPAPTRVAASVATAAAAGPSGSNSPSRLAGDRPPSGVHGRFSHRRIPKSL